MERASLLELWDAWWDGDIWIAPWGKAVAGLNAEQAWWRPEAVGGAGGAGGARHSIWQNVNHVVFWREYTLTTLAGNPKPSDEDVQARQFAQPAAPTEPAWAEAKGALERTHRAIRDAIADPSNPMDRLMNYLAHDAYHLGQIMYVRGMLGLAPVL